MLCKAREYRPSDLLEVNEQGGTERNAAECVICAATLCVFICKSRYSLDKTLHRSSHTLLVHCL